MAEVSTAARGGFAGLDPCVHCGFCLQACPTYLATGDEADSPRGRIELMRLLERGELAADDPALNRHLSRCLGCRACEPVCPSGVQYGVGLEAARERIAHARRPSFVARLALWLMTTPGVSHIVYRLARWLRATGLPARWVGWGRLGFAMGMLAATDHTAGRPPARPEPRSGRRARRPRRPSPGSEHSDSSTTVVLFLGCVMEGLFRHVHDATVRVLEVNGYTVREASSAGCCGALHAHAGLGQEARALARANLDALAGDDPIVVNSAGCGAQLRGYGHLLPDDPRAAQLAARVRDVTEVLTGGNGRGIVPGAPLDLRVAYDPPCHLLHAQRIAEPPLRLFAAIPVLRVERTPDADKCCGSAGLFTLVEPGMARAVLAPKLDELRAASPQVVATGNPGCLMQIGAGLRASGMIIPVRHPVELLDESYRRAGHYA